MKTLVSIEATAKKTRLVVTAGEKVVLRANLPSLTQVVHERAAKVLLEGLSLWLDAKLCVALCAGEEVDCFRFDLADELGVGAHTVFYAIEVVAREPRQQCRGAEVGDAGELMQVVAPGRAR